MIFKTIFIINFPLNFQNKATLNMVRNFIIRIEIARLIKKVMIDEQLIRWRTKYFAVKTKFN